MTFEEFSKRVIDTFLDYMPEEYKDWNVVTNFVEKPEGLLTGLSIKSNKPVEGPVAVPTVYLEHMYADLAHHDFDSVMNHTASMYLKGIEKAKTMTSDLKLSDAKDKIVIKMMSKTANKDYLETVCYDDFMADTVMTYVWVVNKDEQGISTSTIRPDMLDAMGILREDLQSIAMENTRRLMKPMILSMGEALGFPEGPDPMCYILSTSEKMLGGCFIADKEVLADCARDLGENLVIVPSSSEELIIFKASKAPDPNIMKDMIESVNAEQVAPGQQMGSFPFFFDKDEMEVSIYGDDIDLDTDRDIDDDDLDL